ncbi:GNAT family N-acetyltransferase [Ilumatobacter sp.]|uniref:GNAT family N-acetyltransferase n=1 Tax=Ilumatobacter sp. TaxID=1967498 RepID=UPI003B517941
MAETIRPHNYWTTPRGSPHNYLAVDLSCRGDGVGRLITDRAEQHLKVSGCPKINLQIRVENTGAIQFYERLGFSIDDVVSMGKRLIDDDSTPER